APIQFCTLHSSYTSHSADRLPSFSTMHYSTEYDNHSGSLNSHSNAHANEDWSKISDLAERRRIQNRIAQRNYRKKLKRRLEDLERRAASSASPEQSHAKPILPKSSPTKTRTKMRTSMSVADVKPHNSHSSDRPASYECYTSSDDRQNIFAQVCTRQLSEFPPQALYYPSMSPYDAHRQSAYFQSPFYHATSINYNEIATYQTEYSDPVFTVVPMLPSLHTAGKSAYDKDSTSPFSIRYATMADFELGQQQQQAHSQNALSNSLPLIIYPVCAFPGNTTCILHGRSLATISDVTRRIYFHVPTHTRIRFICDVFPPSGMIADSVAS
ncbi:hypothetical protein N7499_003445, partial [Penicillium canescens]